MNQWDVEISVEPWGIRWKIYFVQHLVHTVVTWLLIVSSQADSECNSTWVPMIPSQSNPCHQSIVGIPGSVLCQLHPLSSPMIGSAYLMSKWCRKPTTLLCLHTIASRPTFHLWQKQECSCHHVHLPLFIPLIDTDCIQQTRQTLYSLQPGSFTQTQGSN